MFWIRYLNNILIGVIGSLTECKTIKNEIFKNIEFFKIKIQKCKSIIRDTKTKKIRFLGADLSIKKKKLSIKIYKSNKIILTKIAVTKIQLNIPIIYLIKKYESKGYLISYRKKTIFRARRQNKYCTYHEYVIVKHFSYIIQSLVNYYIFANTRSSLWKVIYLIRKSCALTLASKFSINSAASIFKKVWQEIVWSNALKNVIFFS